MNKEQLINLSKKFSKSIKFESATDVFTTLTKDNIFKSLPLSVTDKVYLSFLIVNKDRVKDLSELYNKIERSLFKSEMTYIDEKDAEGTCEDCGGAGQYQCDTCRGDGEIDCSECDGEGEVYSYHDEFSEPCQSCHGGEVEDCYDCSSSGQIDCETCFGEGVVVVEGSALVSEIMIFSFNPSLFNSLELIDTGLVNQDLFDDILKDKFMSILYRGNDPYKFYPHEYDWALKDDIVLESLELI